VDTIAISSSHHGSVAPGCSGRARSADFPDLPASGRTRFAHFHGALYRFRDPTRISLARCKVYDETIRVMKLAVRNAKLGPDEEMQALKRLDDQARRL
jgi:hypothetical protein